MKIFLTGYSNTTATAVKFLMWDVEVLLFIISAITTSTLRLHTPLLSPHTTRHTFC